MQIREGQFRVCGEYIEEFNQATKQWDQVHCVAPVKGRWVCEEGSPWLWDGYPKINYINTNGERKCMSLHKLNYIIHHGDYDERMHIHHIDGNRCNWAISNLQALGPSAHSREHAERKLLQRAIILAVKLGLL